MKTEIQPKNCSFLLSLPNETLLQIFSYLNFNDLLNLARVSKKTKKISENPFLWFLSLNPRNDFILRTPTAQAAQAIVRKSKSAAIPVDIIDLGLEINLYARIQNTTPYHLIRDFWSGELIFPQPQFGRTFWVKYGHMSYQKISDEALGLISLTNAHDLEIAKNFITERKIKNLVFFVTNKENYAELAKLTTRLLVYDPEQPFTTFFNTMMQEVHKIANHVPENKMAVRRR